MSSSTPPGMMVMPGLIDSARPSLPEDDAAAENGRLPESAIHGGVTTSISASEVRRSAVSRVSLA